MINNISHSYIFQLSKTLSLSLFFQTITPSISYLYPQPYRPFRIPSTSVTTTATTTKIINPSIVSHHCFPIYSSMMTNAPISDEDPLKWEKMYANGANASPDEDNKRIKNPKSEVRVITFDLDNTLWKTSEVIGAANDALASFLDDAGIQQPKRTEAVMGDLFKANMARYNPELKDIQEKEEKDQKSTTNGTKSSTGGGGGGGPVYLTQLRKDAVKFICMEYNEYSETDALDLAHQAFQAWTNARHAAIPTHFANSVISCLTQIRAMTTSTGHPVIVGAITDGNSNPLIVPELTPFFDFCVNAESVGISKPNRKIYETAVHQVSQMESVRDIFAAGADAAGADAADADAGDTTNDLTSDIMEDLVGSWWIHIGDHFMKDIVAAKSMNMRTIWARELVMTDELQQKVTQAKAKQMEEKELTTFVKKISSMKTIEMNIGADDFLKDSVEREFADAIVYQFDHLYDVLYQWQKEALMIKNEKIGVDAEEKDIITMSSSPVGQPVLPNTAKQMKFCVHCGTKLVLEAKFCSSCGEKQIDL